MISLIKSLLSNVSNHVKWRRGVSQVRITSDGCSGYTAKIVSDDRQNSTPLVHFQNLAQARRYAKRHGASNVIFEHRFADDETGYSQSPGFSRLPC